MPARDGGEPVPGNLPRSMVAEVDSLRRILLAPSIFGLPKINRVFAVATLMIMVAIFLSDLWLELPIGLAGLYCVGIVMSGAQARTYWVIGATVLSGALTIVAYALAHLSEHVGEAFVVLVYVLLAQIATAFVTLCGVMATKLIRDQATVLDTISDSVSIRALDGTLTYWNRAAVDRYGWTFDEARSVPLHELLKTDTPVPPMEIDAFVDRRSWEGEIVAFARDGRRLVVDCRCSLLSDNAGRPTAILTTGSDVTPRAVAAEALRRSETRYRNILATTGISIWECDFSAVRRRHLELHENGMRDLRRYLEENPQFVREGIRLTKAVDVNDTSLKIFGATTKEQLLGSIDYIWPEESERFFAESMIAGWEGKPMIVGETSLKTLDGRTIDVLLSTAFPPEADTRESIFVTVADMTARNAVQSALRQSQLDLAHAARLASLGELTASIAHEVNQPLAGILTNGEAGLRWLSRPTPDFERASVSFRNVVSEAKRAGKVIEGIRAFSRKGSLHPETFDLSELISESLLLLSFEMLRGRVAISTAFDPDLGAVRADKTQVQQVVINLLLNAVHALGTIDDRARRIWVACRGHAENAEVTITDNGPGIPAQIQARLFEAFTTSREEGTGLGLKVCAAIVKRHGGTIWNDPRDIGTSFGFSLPAKGVGVEPEPR